MVDQLPKQKVTLRWVLGASATVLAILAIGYVIQAPQWATVLAVFLAFAIYGIVTRKNWRGGKN